MIQIENIYDICFILLHMPLTTPVYVIKLLHLLKLLHLAEFLHLPLTAPVYVRRLLHLAFLHSPALLHLAVLHTSIEVLLRPTLGQSDEPSDLRGSLSPMPECIQHLAVTRRSPIQL